MKENVDALYCDPNAFIKKEKENSKKISRVVFSEPYDCLPNYYVNYGFKKGNCECLPKRKDDKCEQKGLHKNKCECGNVNPFSSLLGGLTNFLPMLLNGGNEGIAKIFSSLSAGSGNSSMNGLFSALNNNPQNNLLGQLFSNGDLITNILSVFKSNSKNKDKVRDIISTDYEIKKYTRV